MKLTMFKINGTTVDPKRSLLHNRSVIMSVETVGLHKADKTGQGDSFRQVVKTEIH